MSVSVKTWKILLRIFVWFFMTHWHWYDSHWCLQRSSHFKSCQNSSSHPLRSLLSFSTCLLNWKNGKPNPNIHVNYSRIHVEFLDLRLSAFVNNIYFNLFSRDGLPEVFCKSESRKKIRQSNPNLLVQNLKSTRLRVRVRPCDRFIQPKAPIPVMTTPSPTPNPRKRSSHH